MFVKVLTSAVVFVSLVFFSLTATAAEEGQSISRNRTMPPFKAGEKLTYEISWSNVLEAGQAIMEVKKEMVAGKTAYRLISTARTSGMVSKFYKVSDRVESVIDCEKMYSLAFQLDQNHGKRKKKE